jgi:hypothetical protein
MISEAAQKAKDLSEPPNIRMRKGEGKSDSVKLLAMMGNGGGG